MKSLFSVKTMIGAVLLTTLVLGTGATQASAPAPQRVPATIEAPLCGPGAIPESDGEIETIVVYGHPAGLTAQRWTM